MNKGVLPGKEAYTDTDRREYGWRLPWVKSTILTIKNLHRFYKRVHHIYSVIDQAAGCTPRQ